MAPATQKIWVKKNKMRMETTAAGPSTVSLIDMDAKTMYMYIPAQNMAMKVDFKTAPESATKTAGTIESYQPVVLGTETLDGKVCTVIQYTTADAKTKAWIWKDRGLPIRIEATTTAGTTVMEYKNIDFSDIPDSMFVLPPGVQIIDMPGLPPTK